MEIDSGVDWRSRLLPSADYLKHHLKEHAAVFPDQASCTESYTLDITAGVFGTILITSTLPQTIYFQSFLYDKSSHGDLNRTLYTYVNCSTHDPHCDGLHNSITFQQIDFYCMVETNEKTLGGKKLYWQCHW